MQMKHEDSSLLPAPIAPHSGELYSYRQAHPSLTSPGRGAPETEWSLQPSPVNTQLAHSIPWELEEVTSSSVSDQLGFMTF